MLLHFDAFLCTQTNKFAIPAHFRYVAQDANDQPVSSEQLLFGKQLAD